MEIVTFVELMDACLWESKNFAKHVGALALL